MKKITVFIIAITIIFSTVIPSFADSWTDNWTINGFPVSKFSHTTGEEKLQLIGGIAATWTVHWLSHVTYISLLGKKWHQEGTSEIVDEYLTNKQAREFAMSGMVGQLIFGSFLKIFVEEDNMFTTGFHIGTFTEISTYPLFHPDDGDFNLYESRGGNSNIAYFVLTGWSTALLIDKK